MNWRTALSQVGLRQRFTLYTALLTGGAAILFTTLSYLNTRALIQHEIEEHLSDAALHLGEHLSQSLDIAGNEVRVLARQSMLANALLDSHGRDAYLKPFLAQHQLPLDIPYNLVVTDYLGRPLAWRSAAVSHVGEGWLLDALAEGKERTRIGDANDAHVLNVAAPIMYGFTGTYEGAVIYSTRLDDWLRHLARRTNINTMLSRVELRNGDALVASLMLRPSESLRWLDRALAPGTLPFNPPLVLRVAVDQHAYEQPLRNLLFSHLLGGTLAVLLATLASHLLAQVQVRRVEELAREARAIADSGESHHALTRDRFGEDEIGDLASTLGALLGELKSHQTNLEAEIGRRTRELHEREADLSRAQAVARVGSWVMDLTSDDLQWSAETYRLLGIAPGQRARYADFLDRVHPDDRPALDDAWQAARRGATADYDIEFRARVHGNELWLRARAEFQHDDSGRPVEAIGTLQDITERRRTEERLRTLSTAVHESPASIVITDLDGTIVYVNPQFERVTGYSAAEAIGQNPRLLKSERMSRDDYTGLWATLTAGETWRGEFENVRRDGTHYWEIASISPIHDAHGAISGYIAVKEDVTERKRMESALRDSEEYNKTLFSGSHIPLVILSTDSYSFIDCNQAAADIYGLGTREQVIGRTPFDVSTPTQYDGRPSRVVGLERLEKARAFGSLIFEWRHVRPDGEIWDAEVHLMTLSHQGRELIQFSLQDITERRRMQARMQEALEVFNASSQGIMTTDAQGLIATVNPAFCRITGYDADEVIGRSPAMFKSGRHEATFYQTMWKTIDEAGCWEGEIWNRRKSGEIYPQWLTISVVRDDNGEIVEYVALFRDITLHKQQEEAIWRQANFDALTGLANRNLLHDRLDRALAQARRNQRKVGLLFIDLDGFKWINDTLGHKVGDDLLVEVARRLRLCVREQDTVARLGGDEFTLVVNPIQNADDLQPIAEKVVHILRAPFALAGTEHHISGSVGITLYPDDGDDVQALLRNADIAMYKSKQTGKNRFHFYARQMQADAQARMEIEAALRIAVRDAAFVLHYQPIVDGRSGRIVGAEALIRWRHPERGDISPLEFIPVAEDCGLIADIGRWALEEAARQWSRWRAAGYGDLRVAVNVSGVQFREPELPALIAELIADHGMPEGRLMLEITESVLMNSSEAAEARLRDIRALGARYALDDFGTGYSSLSYLKRFPVDVVKIDRSFVRDCPDDHKDATLVEAIVHMAHSLELKVTAEGVENEAQREFLQRLGCDYLQGYLISRPLPAAEFLERLAQDADYAALA